MRTNRVRSMLVILFSMILAWGSLPALSAAEEMNYPTFTFSETGIAVSGASSSNYKITDTTLSINAPGTYVVTGDCSEGNIIIKKELSGVTLIIKDLMLSSSTTSPLVCKKSSEVLLIAEGDSILTDEEKLANETSEDFEGAAIKVGSGATLSIGGNGSLTVDGSLCKNGIKGGSQSIITIEDSVNLTALAANNGLASDHRIVINGGIITINAGGDGIKSEPDEGDNLSEGSVAIFGGSLSVTAGDDGIQATGRIEINEGDLNVDANDDAFHSDGTIHITGGDLSIKAGDDAIHADSLLKLGKEGGDDAAIHVTVSASREGLESKSVNFYSGYYDINSSDDGVNSTSEEYEEQLSTLCPINVYGGNITVNCKADAFDANGDINLLGGNLILWGVSTGVDSPLDYNGKLVVNGARVFAAGCRGVDHIAPAEGSQPYVLNEGASIVTIEKGQTIHVMGHLNQEVFRIKTIKAVSLVFYSAPNMSYGGTIRIDNEAAGCCPMFHVWYLTGSTTTCTDYGENSYECSICGETKTEVPSKPAPHAQGTIMDKKQATCTEEGSVTYICSLCGNEITESLPATGHQYEEGYCRNCGEEDSDAEWFIVDFEARHCTVNVFLTQELTEDCLDIEDVHYARNSSTGLKDISGDGQVNFIIVPEDGFEIAEVTADANYKNLKENVGEQPNTYRLTKVTGDVTVTVITRKTAGDPYSYSLVYDANDGSGTSIAQTAESMDTVYQMTVTNEKPTRSGYSFKGWSENPGASVSSYKPGSSIVLSDEEPSKTLYAVWGTETSGGGGGGSAVTPDPVPGNDPSPVPDDPEPTPGPVPEILFEDVPDGEYYYDPVKWAVNGGITNGIDETHFGPDLSCTRAQMVTFLWRAAGSPEPGSADNPFTDVEAGSYYEKAVLWAVEKEITNGTSETTFSPDMTVTRGQSVTFLYRLQGEPSLASPAGGGVTEGDGEGAFSDVSQDAYYYDAVRWATENEVTKGTSETTFEPESPCTRAQIATFLYRAMTE